MQNIENVRRGRDYVWQKWKNFKKTDQKNPDPGAGCEDWFTAAFAGTDTIHTLVDASGEINNFCVLAAKLDGNVRFRRIIF